MKKYIFIILYFFFFFSSTTIAQSVDHFTDSTSKWFVANSYPNANPQNPGFVETKTVVYGFKGDTIMNSKAWKKLYSASDSLFTYELELEGFINSENNLILYKDTNYQIDTLYDFNLSVGDSVYYDLIVNPQKIAIINIDSIIINGKYYKRFIFDEPSGINPFYLNERWIEGIGSTHSPLFPVRPGLFTTEYPGSQLLTCSYSNGIQYWQDTSFNRCYVNILLSLNEFNSVNFNIYPSPSNSIMQLEIEDEINIQEITLYDLSGKIVRTYQEEQRQFNIEGIQSGTYFIQVKTSEGIATKKVIVQ